VSARAIEPLPVARAAELAALDPSRRWLVESLWSRAGVGILGGPPKCNKSWLALDVALSVATGTPCLDAFEVHESGDALLVMAEDAPQIVRARLESICAHRGLALQSAPVHLVLAHALRLDLDRDRDRLRETVARMKPRLLVLDPFVRLHRLEENHAGDVSGLLGWLRSLSREHDLAILVVHHARKNGSTTQAGQALRGSGDFHAWGDDNLYLRRKAERIVLAVEHRAAPPPDPLALALVEHQGATHLEIVGSASEPTPPSHLDAAILAALAREPKPRARLRAELHVRNETLGLALRRLESEHRLSRDGDRWQLVPIPPP
jgi:AAA domain